MPDTAKKLPTVTGHLVILADIEGNRRGAIVASEALKDAAAAIASGQARPAQPLDLLIAGEAAPDTKES